MSWTKQQIIDDAYGELALQGFVFTLDPDMLQSALRRLDSMMATWNGKGIRLGYALPSSSASSSLDSESGLPDWANEAAYLNLALRLAAGHGKVIAQGTAIAAKQAYDGLLSRIAYPPQQQLPGNLPRGSGNKPHRGQQNPFFSPVESIVTSNGDSEIELN